MIYLDNAATTRVDQEVVNAMIPYFWGAYGNPGSPSSLGRQAKEAVDRAREKVAKFIGANPDDILFTSGGSESNNLALIGTARAIYKTLGKRFCIVCSAIEHHSVLSAVKSISDICDVNYVYPNKLGVVTASAVSEALTDDTYMVCVMHTNNETGMVNEIEQIGNLCNDRSIIFFTDCVQAAGFSDIDVNQIGCDLLSISSHKIHGPKGVGALYCRDKSLLSPIIYGGNEQEFGLRGGTENVPGIVGFGEACDIASRCAAVKRVYISELKSVFFNRLKECMMESGTFDSVSLNGDPLNCPGKVMSISFSGVDGETMVMVLDMYGVAVSAGSACNSTEQVPSHVLIAMGVSPETARSTIRLSFSKYNTVDEAVLSAETISKCVNRLIGGVMP